MIPEFAALYTRDKSKDKARAILELSYVYSLVDPNSPYANYSEAKRLEMLHLDLFKDPKFKPDGLIEAAKKRYIELTDTPLKRLLRASQAKIDEFADYLAKSKVTDATSTELLKIMGGLSTLVGNHSTLEQQIERDDVKRGRVRGQVTVGDYER